MIVDEGKNILLAKENIIMVRVKGSLVGRDVCFPQTILCLASIGNFPFLISVTSLIL